MTGIGRQAFQQQVDGLRKVLVGSANVPDLLDEYLFGSQQSLILSTVNQVAATRAGALHAGTHGCAAGADRRGILRRARAAARDVDQ